MYKVEIRNLDTAKLPRIPNEELMKLLIKAKSGDNVAREEFIYANLRLVLSLVQKFNNRGENLDDIFQVGVIGLLKAIDNFDTSLNVQFSTYAVPMIIGEIKRFFRDTSSIKVTRSMRDIAYKVMKEKEMFIAKNLREPTIIELSEAIGESREDIVVAIESMVEPVSIYETIYNDSGNTIEVIDQLKDNKNEAEDLINHMLIENLLLKLNDKERKIIETRFFKNKTQVELAEEIGVSQAQISRIEKTALIKMKKNLGKIY